MRSLGWIWITVLLWGTLGCSKDSSKNPTGSARVACANDTACKQDSLCQAGGCRTMTALLTETLARLEPLQRAAAAGEAARQRLLDAGVPVDTDIRRHLRQTKAGLEGRLHDLCARAKKKWPAIASSRPDLAKICRCEWAPCEKKAPKAAAASPDGGATPPATAAPAE